MWIKLLKTPEDLIKYLNKINNLSNKWIKKSDQALSHLHCFNHRACRDSICKMNNSKDMLIRNQTTTRRSMICINVLDTKSLLKSSDPEIWRQKWDSRQIISSKKTKLSRYTLSQKCHKLPLGLSPGSHHLNKMSKICLKLSHQKTWTSGKSQKSRFSTNKITEVKASLRAKENISLSVSKKWSRSTLMNFRVKLSQHLVL